MSNFIKSVNFISPKKEMYSNLEGLKSITVYLLNKQKINTTLPIDWLSSKEKLRYDRYFFKKDKDQFLFSKILQRYILGKKLNLHPKEISFSHNAYGKPSLSQEHKTNLILNFNLSHSLKWSIFAISFLGPIGIDIENISPLEKEFSLSELVLSKQELKDFQKLNKKEKLEKFYCYWTAKESYLKMLGKGFSINPQQVFIDFFQKKALFSRSKNGFLKLYNFRNQIISICLDKAIKSVNFRLFNLDKTLM